MKGYSRRGRLPYILAIAAVFLALLVLSLPSISIVREKYFPGNGAANSFPVTVDPANKTITENPSVEAMFAKQESGLAAAAITAGNIFDNLAAAVASTPLYEAISASPSRLVVINPGFRKEEIAAAFGKALGWDAATQKSFIAAADAPLPDGDLYPDTYVVDTGTTPAEVRLLIEDRFENEILSRYATSTAEVVPVSQALNIASMIERETSDPTEMRLISGIMWNRLFAGMKLQIDATLQYAKATSLAAKTPTKNWWPAVTSKDKYIKSPYNTYANAGLPPAPISNPSTAAILAALNPKKTDCLFYFHDKLGGFHCSATYAEHVTLLKKYYGQGK